MVSLETKYLGLQLKNPIIIGSSGLTGNYESIARLAQHGAAAVVLKSLFEEEIQMEFRHTMKNQLGFQENNLDFFDYYDYKLKDDMLKKNALLISEIKEKLDIKVIASINCSTVGEWYSYAKKLEEAGADALELNIYSLATDIEEDAGIISARYEKIVKKVLDRVSIPVSVKMSPYFTDTANMAARLVSLGVKGLVLFNRFYNPDIDLVNNKIVVGQVYSNPGDYSWPLRWISILSQKIKADFVASNGIHTADSAIKMLISGAVAVQVVSAIYKNGSDYILDLSHGIEKWMESKGLNNIEQLHQYGQTMMPANPALFERVQFMRYFGDHS